LTWKVSNAMERALQYTYVSADTMDWIKE
jgi:hypothetical protein